MVRQIVPDQPMNAILYPEDRVESHIQMGAAPLEWGSGCEVVVGSVVAFVFGLQVVGPVGVEVAVGVWGAEFEDGFGGG